MSNFSDQLDEIKSLISSGTKSNKSLAYSTLSHLQEQSPDDHALIQTLAVSSGSLLRLIVADLDTEDEEIATQALKCLGFMIYHPAIVAAVLAEDVRLVLEALVRLITTTKFKSVCNLGVWCISMQQLSKPLLAPHFPSLLRAVVHAIDNPIGSLSITFEAIQAVIKLATVLSENMRDLSHIWAPPIYRRLLSADKRDRDMSERCLLKIKPTIIPPPISLSKVLVRDLKTKLLTGMHDMLRSGMKVQTIQAWGWYIRLLGSYALKNRHLINDMLKIPERTFSDDDSQVQIASQVAWEGLIDALIHPPMILPCSSNDAKEDGRMQRKGIQEINSGEIQKTGTLKSTRLIMTPLIGIMLSKCDVSVHLACLNTWCYLLHRLGASLNDCSMINLVLDPIFEAAFQLDPDGRSFWARDVCINLLDDFISAKCKPLDYDPHNQVIQRSSAKTSVHSPIMSGCCSWKQYPINWLPWDLSLLDFHLKMIYSLICQSSSQTVCHDSKVPADEAPLRLFRDVLKGVGHEFKRPSINYDDIMLCLNAILKFIRNICEEVSLDGSDRHGLHHIALQFIEAVSEEIEPTIMGSPLYKVALNMKYIENLQVLPDIGYEKSGVCSIGYMEMVSPMVYLSVLYFCEVVHSSLSASKVDYILLGMQQFTKFMLSSFGSLESLVITTELLYKHIGPGCLTMWIAIAEGLKSYINDVNNRLVFKTECESKSCYAMSHLMSYPLLVCSCSQKDIMSVKSGRPAETPSYPWVKTELEQVITLWKSLYGSVCASLSGCTTAGSFSEDLVSVLDRCFDKHTSRLGCADELHLKFKDMDLHIVSLYIDALLCILKNSSSSDLSSDRNTKHGYDHKISGGIKGCLTLAIRCMKLSQTKIGTDVPIGLPMSSRLYSALALFIKSLHLKQDIVSLLEIISCPLLEWLTRMETQAEGTSDQFELLWIEMLNCLRRSQPPIVFDSAFLKLQADILEKTLEHSQLSISEPTITFWNATYGEQVNLDYPQTLRHVLDKLWRKGRINLHKSSLPLQRCQSKSEAITAPPRFTVNTAHNRGSKRVELAGNNMDSKHKDMPHSSLKRKRVELTEHQKEVRRAQRGRGRDCGGHGIGFQTYTTLDFSQGNEDSQGNKDSQDSEDIRNPECILQMLRNR